MCKLVPANITIKQWMRQIWPFSKLYHENIQNTKVEWWKSSNYVWGLDLSSRFCNKVHHSQVQCVLINRLCPLLLCFFLLEVFEVQNKAWWTCAILHEFYCRILLKLLIFSANTFFFFASWIWIWDVMQVDVNQDYTIRSILESQYCREGIFEA